MVGRSQQDVPVDARLPSATVSAATLNFRVRLAEDWAGPRFIGPTLRGLFGLVFKRLVCQVHHGRCGECRLREACPYPIVFEGQPPPRRDVMRLYPRVPQPFVLIVPGPLEPPLHTELEFGIRLLGEATRWAPYVAETMIRAGELGLGPRRIQYEVESIDGDHGPVWRRGGNSLALPAATDARRLAPVRSRRLLLQFHTPLEIRDRDTAPGAFSPLALVLAGRRRWRLLSSLHGQTAADPTIAHIDERDFRVVEQNLRDWRIERPSRSQGTTMKMTGLVGSVVVEGPWDCAGEWLSAAPVIHLGRHTSFGFGRVSVEELGD